MSLKLSAGCQCCDDEPTLVCGDCCSTTTVQDEYEVVLSGLTDTSDCDICTNINGTYTLNNRVAKSSPWVDGWSGGWGTEWSKAADVNSFATDACVWTYVSSPELSCEWDITQEQWGFEDTTYYSFRFAGLTLAKFKITSSSFQWRLIVNFEMYIRCTGDWSSEQDTRNVAWYWSKNESTSDCNLSATDSWTASEPSWDFMVSCNFGHSADFSDFCGGSLSLVSVENG